MCSGRTVLFSVLAPGLMKQRSVPGTRIETWPNIPISPCRFNIRVNVAVFARNSSSRLMPCTRFLKRLAGAGALDQLSPSIDFRGQKGLQLGRAWTLGRKHAELDDQRLDIGNFRRGRY